MVPILDTTVALSSRIYRGLTPFNGGKDHLSHRLVRVGFTHRTAAFILWGISGTCTALAYLIYKYPSQIGTQIIISAGLVGLAALIFFLRIPSQDLETDQKSLNGSDSANGSIR
jgi:UDP-GlcNAc:undecaprenyl-phosphate GlcNAc-1-phosphate transferase